MSKDLGKINYFIIVMIIIAFFVQILSKKEAHFIQWQIFSIIYAEILKITTENKYEIFIQIAK